jgi:hypothetical protein
MRKIVIAGKGFLCINAIRLARMYYDTVLVLPVIPEPIWTDSVLNFCSKECVTTIDSGDFNDIPDRQFTVLYSVFYDRIFDKACLDKFEHKFNFHNAPLPKYRGVNPINWALANNEKEHGISIHKITEKIDDGDIISQINYPIFPKFDSVGSVYRRAKQFGTLLMEYTFPYLEILDGIPQNEKLATYYKKEDYGKLPTIFKGWNRKPTES